MPSKVEPRQNNLLAIHSSPAGVLLKWWHNMGWFNLNENSSHSRGTHWILILAQVFLRHSVYVFFCSIECHFTDAPADCGHLVGTRWIGNVERDLGIPDRVSVLLAPLISVDNDNIALVVNPSLSDVRRPIRHQRGKVRV